MDKVFDDKELQVIEDLAGLFFKAEEIAAVLEVDPLEFTTLIIFGANPAHARFMKGWLEAEFKLRKSISDSASNGSNPAQNLMLQFLNNNKNA
ncbi:MAG: hypothetical protein ACOYOV_06295 [Bacteroidales bacterium]